MCTCRFMYLVQPYMLTCRWLERCFHTVPSVLVLLHPGVPDELESSKLSFEGWKGLFLLIVTDTNRIPSESIEFQKLKNRMFCSSHRPDRTCHPWKSGDLFFTLLTGPIVKRKSKDENLWSLIHWLDRSVGQIGRPRQILIYRQGFVDQSSSF